MNEYTKHVWKRNITAFLLSALVLLSVTGSILLIIWVGALLGNYLPYVALSVLLFAMVFMISIPMRQYLEDRENAKIYWAKKDKERLLREANKEKERLEREVSEQMRAAHAVRKRDHLI